MPLCALPRRSFSARSASNSSDPDAAATPRPHPATAPCPLHPSSVSHLSLRRSHGPSRGGSSLRRQRRGEGSGAASMARMHTRHATPGRALAPPQLWPRVSCPASLMGNGSHEEKMRMWEGTLGDEVRSRHERLSPGDIESRRRSAARGRDAFSLSSLCSPREAPLPPLHPGPPPSPVASLRCCLPAIEEASVLRQPEALRP